MRNILLLLAFVLASVAASGQHVRESALSLKRKFTPLFGSTSAVMTMNLVNDFEVGGKDSVYSFVVAVTETETEVQSVSLGLSSFSVGKLVGGGGSAGVTASIKKQDGVVDMSREDFGNFYKCINDVYKATGTMSVLSKKKNTVCTCEVKGIEFGGEYLPERATGNDQKFYFRLGEAVFSMSKLDFEEIVRFVREVKGVYDVRG